MPRVNRTRARVVLNRWKVDRNSLRWERRDAGRTMASRHGNIVTQITMPLFQAFRTRSYPPRDVGGQPRSFRRTHRSRR